MLLAVLFACCFGAAAANVACAVGAGASALDKLGADGCDAEAAQATLPGALERLGADEEDMKVQLLQHSKVQSRFPTLASAIVASPLAAEERDGAEGAKPAAELAALPATPAPANSPAVVAPAAGEAAPVALAAAELAAAVSPANTSATSLGAVREYELRLSGEDASGRGTQSKVALALVEMLGIGVFGVDRCLMGQVFWGIVKGGTMGGLMVWWFADYVVVVANCLRSSDSLKSLGYDAAFRLEGVQPAFWICLVIFALKVIGAVTGYRRKIRRRRVPNAGGDEATAA